MGTHAKMTAEDYTAFEGIIGKKYTGRKKRLIAELHAKYYHHNFFLPECGKNCYENFYNDLKKTYNNGKR